MIPPANAARGEVGFDLLGRPRRLVLTLGALAELEAAFGAPDLEALAGRLARLSAGDLIVVLAALLRGGGEDLSVEDLTRAPLDPVAASEAIAEAFRRAFDG